MNEWEKKDCIHHYEYYTFLSQGMVLMPECNLHQFNCNGCEYYEK